jgi:hypothetical protein
MSKSLGMPIERVRQMLLARSPLGRSVPPGDVSAMIRYLASEFGRSTTGQDIDVAAGMAFRDKFKSHWDIFTEKWTPVFSRKASCHFEVARKLRVIRRDPG